MKICNSPASTSCIYQRIARDQAPPDAGASSDAYEELSKFLAANLDPSALSEAEALLRRFLDASGGEGSGATFASDAPLPFDGRPTVAQDAARHVAASVRSGKAQASSYLFDRKFPGAARIRVVG